MTHENAYPPETLVEITRIPVPFSSPLQDGYHSEGLRKMRLIVPSVETAMGREPAYIQSHFGQTPKTPKSDEFPLGHGWRTLKQVTVKGKLYYVLEIPCSCPNCTTIAALLLTHIDVEEF